MEEEGREGEHGSTAIEDATRGQAAEFPSFGGHASPVGRTPLFAAQHSARYDRQLLIGRYQDLTGARLIVMIDQVFHHGVTLLEELVADADPTKPLHLMLSTPGGDGEVAVRLLRLLQSRCSELTIVIPDMAKSAGTIMCLGADHILMAPMSDLGPVDPQFQVGDRLVGAKEIDRAVASAEERINQAPDSYPLYAGLLADVNMIMVEQARSAMSRSYDLIKEALECASRQSSDVDSLASALRVPLIDEATNHGATVGPATALGLGLPVIEADLDSVEWKLIWALWTRYFELGAWPAGRRSVYEGRYASQVFG